MLHPHTTLRYINPTIGYGVFATQEIPKGTMIWVQDELDREITQNEFESLDVIYQTILDKYTFRNKKGNYVLCWDLTKYMNHSFKPNCIPTTFRFELAIKDIKKGEQLTNDYGFFNITEPFRGFEEGTRRKVVYPNDLIKYHSIWDKLLENSIKKFFVVDQPLKDLLSKDTILELQKIVNRKLKLPSILDLYYSNVEYNRSIDQ